MYPYAVICVTCVTETRTDMKESKDKLQCRANTKTIPSKDIQQLQPQQVPKETETEAHQENDSKLL